MTQWPVRQRIRAMEELLGDFVSLVTTFAGCPYGMRSAAARKRLLAESDRRPPGGGR